MIHFTRPDHEQHLTVQVWKIYKTWSRTIFDSTSVNNPQDSIANRLWHYKCDTKRFKKDRDLTTNNLWRYKCEQFMTWSSWTTFDSTSRAYGPYIYNLHIITNSQSKWSRSFCQKCRWQVAAKHTCILCMWFWIKWHRWLMRGCMVWTNLAPRRQHFHVARTIHQTARYNHFGGYSKRAVWSSSHWIRVA